MQTNYRSNGKLLISGEYFVLDGALSLAIPTKMGQSMVVTILNEPKTLIWRSYGIDGPDQIWFEAYFNINKLMPEQASDPKAAQALAALFQSIQRQRPGFWNNHVNTGLIIETFLEFPRKWGLGTSSTLINNLTQWSNTDPYELLRKSFGGSGYDLACANAKGPILFQRIDEKPQYVHYPFLPPFLDQIYFVYLGKKQNSREGIARYRQLMAQPNPALIDEVSSLSAQLSAAHSLEEWNDLIEVHEDLISKSIALPKVKDLYFKDFPGQVKSLGAWGGDFAMASANWSKKEMENYFLDKGFDVVLPYNKMVLTEKTSTLPAE